MYERKVLTVETRTRDTFEAFFVSEEYCCDGSQPRFDGTETMRRVTLEEVEREYGHIETQMWKVILLEDPDPANNAPTVRIVEEMMIWTEQSVISIHNYDGKESIGDVPRNPSRYK